MGLFKALRTVIGVVNKASQVAQKVTPVVEVAEVAVNEVGKTVAPKKGKK